MRDLYAQFICACAVLHIVCTGGIGLPSHALFCAHVVKSRVAMAHKGGAKKKERNARWLLIAGGGFNGYGYGYALLTGVRVIYAGFSASLKFNTAKAILLTLNIYMYVEPYIEIV